jgi:hypothetical protein
MRRPFARLRGWRPLFVLGIALNTALLMSGLGATPAGAITQPPDTYNTMTKTGWLPLMCNLDGNLAGNAPAPHGNIPIHIGVVLTATMPATLTPGQTFALTKVTSYQVQPAAAQFAANGYQADQVAGVVGDFENHLTGAVGAFLAPNNTAQLNQVVALQPNNIDAPSPPDPLVDPQAGSPAPGQWWTDLGVGDTAERHGVFSFGGIPIDTSNVNAPTAYGPTPGTGGGPTLGSGIADPINVYPFKVTGASGTNVVLDVGGPPPNAVVHLNDTSPDGEFVAYAGVFFRNNTTHVWETPPLGTGNTIPTYCGHDTSTFKVLNPNPCPGAGCWVDNFQIPIVPKPGRLRVSTNPALPSQITVDGNIADSWGLTWLRSTPGPHTVCFTHIEGYTEPACSSQTVVDGADTTLVGNFTQRGSLRVLTSPAKPSQISVDGIPRDNWGMWTDIPVGSHQVCFGPTPNFTPPVCQTAVITAGALTTITGTMTNTPGSPGLTGVGRLRVSTSPALPSQITVDGNIADSWGLAWLQLPPGNHTVCFTHIEGYTEPACSSQTVTVGVDTVMTGPQITFTQRGSLKVLTSPAVAGTVYMDDIPMNNWGMWTDVPVGTHVVCFGWAFSKSLIPPCQNAVVTAGGLTTITGVYK